MTNIDKILNLLDGNTVEEKYNILIEKNKKHKEQTRIEDIESCAYEIFEKYKKHFLQGDESIKGIAVSSKVYVYWEAYWGFGGFDSGHTTFPLEACTKNWKTWITDKINEDIEKEKQEKLKKEQRKKNKEISELKRLKEKYE